MSDQNPNLIITPRQSNTFKSIPIPLGFHELQYEDDEHGALEITTEGMEFLSSIKSSKLNIISIIGSSWQVKSSIDTIGIGGKEGFSKTEDKKGITAWGKPIELQDGNMALVIHIHNIVEASKITICDKDLFILSLLLSSVIIYTINDKVDEGGLNLVQLIETSLPIIKKTKDENIVSEDIAHLIIVFRDCKEDQNQINEKYLKHVKSSTHLKDFFSGASIFILPTITKYDSLDQEIPKNIQTKIDDFRTLIFSKSQPKKTNDINGNGDFGFGLLQSYADNLNSDEDIIINFQMENVILSYLSDKAEDINASCDTTNITEQLKKSNIIESSKIIFNSFLIEQLDKLKDCSVSNVGHGDTILPSIKSIIAKVNEIFDQNSSKGLEKFDSGIDKLFKAKFVYSKSSLVNITETFASLKTYFTELFSPIIKSLNFAFYPRLEKLFQEKVGETGIAISVDLAAQFDKLNNDNKQLQKDIERTKDENNKQIKNYDDEMLKMRLQIENLDRLNKDKEGEYLTMLNIEKDKYTQLEERGKTEILEKDKRITELETSSQPGNSNNQKSGNKTEPSVNIKNDYNRIGNTFIEYKTAVEKLETNQNIFVNNIFIEKTISEIEKKYSKNLDILSEKKTVEHLTNYYETQIQKFKEEKQSMIDTIATQKKQIDEYKIKYEETSKELEGKCNGIEYKSSIIVNNQQSISYYENKIQELLGQVNQGSIDNYDKTEKYLTKENEIEVVLMIVDCILDNDKTKYKNYFVKCCESTQRELQATVNRFKLFQK